MKRLRPFLRVSAACLAAWMPSISSAVELQPESLGTYPEISSPMQMGNDATRAGRGLRPVASSFGDLVVWAEGDKLYANAFDEGVVRWHVPLEVATLAPGAERAYAASSAARQDHINKDEFVVWEKDGAIFGRAVRTDGTMDAPLALSAAGVAASRPRISSSYDRTAGVTRHFVVWQQSAGVWASRVAYENGAYVATAPFRIALTGTDPDVSCNSAGNCVTIYRSAGSQSVMVTAVAYAIEALQPSASLAVRTLLVFPGQPPPSPTSLAMPRVGGTYNSADFVAGYLHADKVELERLQVTGSGSALTLTRVGKITSLDAPRASMLDIASDLNRYAVAYRTRNYPLDLAATSGYIRAAVFASIDDTAPRIFSRTTTRTDTGSAVSFGFNSWHRKGGMWVWDTDGSLLVSGTVQAAIIDEFDVPGMRLLGGVMANPYNNTTAPRIATDGQGNSLLVWLDNANKPLAQKKAMAVLVDRYNARLTAPFAISNDADDVSDIDVAWNGYDYMVVMTTTAPSCKVLARAVTGDGTPHATIFPLRDESSGCARAPKIVRDGFNDRWFHAGWITDDGVYTAYVLWHPWGHYRLYFESRWMATEDAVNLSILYHSPSKDRTEFYMAVELLDYNLPYIIVWGDWAPGGMVTLHTDPQLMSDGQNVYLFSTNTQGPSVYSHRVGAYGELEYPREVGPGYLMPYSVSWNGHNFTAVSRTGVPVPRSTDILLRAHVASPGWYGLERRGEYEIGTFSNEPKTQVRGLVYNGFWDLLVTSEKDTSRSRMTSRFRTITRLFPGQPCSDDTECLSGVCSSPINACQ